MLEVINALISIADAIRNRQKAQDQGWGYELGTGVSFTPGLFVPFNRTFTTPPVVVMSCIGYKDSSNPTSISDFGAWELPNYNLYNITTTGFTVRAGTIDGSVIAATRRVGFTWIANER